MSMEKNYHFSNNTIFYNNKNKLKIIQLSEYYKIKILTYVCPNKTIIPQELINLEELYFYQNINNIPNYFPKLRVLYCNNTGITHIPDTFFQLEYLDCSHNTKLQSIPEIYKNIKKIKYKNTGIIL